MEKKEIIKGYKGFGPDLKCITIKKNKKMNTENIRNEAKRYSEENAWRPGETCCESDIRGMERSFEEAFMEGAMFGINSVWNNAREKVPDNFIPVLVERKNSSFSVNMVGGNMKSCPSSWIRWAYILDLLPERKEETR